MSVSVTAGVYSREIDWSLYVQMISSTIFGMADTFTKGEPNVVYTISSEDELTSKLGKPSTNSQGWYAAREFLRRGNQLRAVRVGNPSTLVKATINALDTNGVASLQFDSINVGSGWNGHTLVLTAGSVSGRKITILNPEGIMLEQFDNITRANAAANINGISTVVTVAVLTSGSPGEPVNQRVVLASGSDGISGLTDSHVIGTSGTSKTGLKLLRNTDAVDINLVAAPGFSSSAVNLELLDLAEARGDSLALIDPPYGLNYQQVRDWHNGISPGDVAYNSSYGALYWDWQQIFDEYNGVSVYTAPSGHIARVIALTDAQAYPWKAPAGLNRGKLGASKGRLNSPDQAQRDYLCGPGQSVNPITNFTNLGTFVWGQKTLQRTSTALDRVNVRRMMLYLRKIIATAALALDFEESDPTTWREFVGLVEPSLRNVAAKRGIRDFRVVCDGTTNTSDVIEQNRMKGKIFIKPTKTAEMIDIDWITTSQGADFNEMVTSA